MSGLVAVASRDPSVVSHGRAALARICRRADAGSDEIRAANAYLGVGGDPALRSVATTMREGVGSGRAMQAVVSGQVFNAAELAGDLGLRGQEHSAAALALKGYLRWGGGLFQRLEGMYALAICDERNELIVAGVDPRHTGALYASSISGDTWLTTEVQALLGVPGFAPALDDASLAELMSRGNLSDGRSPFAGIAGLAVGTHFELAMGRLRVVRHSDDRDMCGGVLRGSAYLDRLEATFRDLAAETFAGGDIVLPVTGGLDSRLLAAGVPQGARPLAFTFGSPDDADVRVGRRIAAARRLPFRRIDFEPDYLERHAVATVRLTEGRLNPAHNLTGCLMAKVAGHRGFVSGTGGEFGRRYMKTVDMLVDWQLVEARGREFIDRAVRRHYEPVLTADHLRDLFGPDGALYYQRGEEIERACFQATEGLRTVDRIDLNFAGLSSWLIRPALLLNREWIPVRAPFHNQRWVSAVLSGDPAQRVDDLARLRLIRRLDPRVAEIPWVLTHLSLATSEPLLLALRRLSRLRPLVDRLPPGLRGRAAASRRLVKSRLYAHGERREEWIRSRTHAYLAGVLLSTRCLERGLFLEKGLRRLLDEQMAGGDHALGLGQLLNIELWHRLFVDGDLDREAGAEAQ